MAAILVIDNDDATRAMVQDVLMDEGYEVYTASSAAGALLQLGAAPPDLMLCSNLLPNLNGVEFCATVQQHDRYRTLPCILMTSAILQETPGYPLPPILRKPFAIDDLLGMVDAQLGERSKKAAGTA